MASWAEMIRQGNLTVKGSKANAHQAQNMALICTRSKVKGGNVGPGGLIETTAGAIATAIQESTITNINYGDRAGPDSLGLYQQRNSWGSAKDRMTPQWAIDKFLSIYIPYRRRGYGWLLASHKTQVSAHPSAPARWYGEAVRAARFFLGTSGIAANIQGAGQITVSSSSSGSSVGGSGSNPPTEQTSYQVTRELPYEFARGSADNKSENTWDCLGRLADEVAWRRYAREGVIRFLSESWLANQAPLYRIQETSSGVLGLTFNAETRKFASEANLRVLASHFALAPGDAVVLFNEGPANGKWLVATTRRNTSRVLELTLKRASEKLEEPAPQTETVTVGGSTSGGGTSSQQNAATAPNQTVRIGGISTATNPSLAAAPTAPQKVYQAAQAISDKRMPYVWGGGHSRAGYPTGGGFDCSGSTVAALAAAGLGYRLGGGVDVSGAMAARWGVAGPGKFFTVYANTQHVWIRWNGMGAAWRFDTSAYGCPGISGPQQRSCPRPTSGFAARHWPGL